ncbi:MAG: hypothetical protein MK212_00050 [Saprospiraceae bacterium]|nr:hypothetical protein [Saprospiraceae bacterium]
MTEPLDKPIKTNTHKGSNLIVAVLLSSILLFLSFPIVSYITEGIEQSLYEDAIAFVQRENNFKAALFSSILFNVPFYISYILLFSMSFKKHFKGNFFKTVGIAVQVPILALLILEIIIFLILGGSFIMSLLDPYRWYTTLTLMFLPILPAIISAYVSWLKKNYFIFVATMLTMIILQSYLLEYLYNNLYPY